MIPVRFLLNTSLGAGLALLALTVTVRVLLWVRAERGTAAPLVRQLLEPLALAAFLVFAVHAAVLVAARTVGLGSELASLLLAAVAGGVGFCPNASPRRRRVPRRVGAAASRGGADGLAFPNYTQIRSRLSVRVWHLLRLASLVGGLTVVALLIVAPTTGLFVLWRVVITVLPAFFMIAPGLWRNLCPLAASNQMPRALGLTRSLTPPAWLKEYGYVIAFSLFIVLVALRRLGLDKSGAWSALLLFGAMASGFTGGMLLKGKSGWCSTICPLLPVQRIYGQTPLITIANAHCQPCVGCVKNCYDFNPRAAYLADLNDTDPYWAGYRRFFVGVFPGLVLSFYVVPRHPALSGLGWMAIFMAASLTIFTAFSTFVKTSVHVLTSLFGAIALSIFYWFGGALGPVELTWLIRLTAITLAATWFVRTLRKEGAFLKRESPAPGLNAPTPPASTAQTDGAGNEPAVTFQPEGNRVVAGPGATLLDLAEAQELPIEAGCRMGICGADPVAIKEGMECTSPISEDEQATLDRLGLAPNTRMACCVRLSGPITASLTPDKLDAASAAPTLDFPYDPAVESVVIVGNGIAGVTAADQLRRRHPYATINLIAEEPHHLYNRMNIARLLYGRSAMEGLYLNSDSWYEERKITTWLNTHAIELTRADRMVRLGTGEALSYDRLILATGSRSHVPPIEGFGLQGTAVLRSAADAMALRAYAQREQASAAVVAGGGLLGLEAAYALQKLGLRTVVLERSDRLLRRQLDARASGLLAAHLHHLGIEILSQVEVRAAHGPGRLQHVELADGRTMPAQVLLVAAGIQPNIELAKRAGLSINRGVIIDDQTRTSDRDIYAAGDVAEHDGQLPGLWRAAVAQAEVAAENAAGGKRRYDPIVPATGLKVAGVDLTSIGRVEAAAPTDEEIVDVHPASRRYQKLVIADGRIVGAILLGVESDIAAAVRGAITHGDDVSDCLERLRAGDWSTLAPS